MPRRRAPLHVPKPEPEPRDGGRPYLVRLARNYLLPEDATEAEIVARISRDRFFRRKRRKLRLPPHATLADLAQEVELIWRDEGDYVDTLIVRYFALEQKIKKLDFERKFTEYALVAIRDGAKECEIDPRQIELPF